MDFLETFLIVIIPTQNILPLKCITRQWDNGALYYFTTVVLHYKYIITSSSIQHPLVTKHSHYFSFFLCTNTVFSTVKGIFHSCFPLIGWHHDITWHYVRDITWHDVTWRDNKVGPKCSLWFIIFGFGLH